MNSTCFSNSLQPRIWVYPSYQSGFLEGEPHNHFPHPSRKGALKDRCFLLSILDLENTHYITTNSPSNVSFIINLFSIASQHTKECLGMYFGNQKTFHHLTTWVFCPIRLQASAHENESEVDETHIALSNSPNSVFFEYSQDHHTLQASSAKLYHIKH